MGPKRLRHVAHLVWRGGSLVDSAPIVRRVVSLNPGLAATYGPLASPPLAVASGASA